MRLSEKLPARLRDSGKLTVQLARRLRQDMLRSEEEKEEVAVENLSISPGCALCRSVHRAAVPSLWTPIDSTTPSRLRIDRASSFNEKSLLLSPSLSKMLMNC